MRRGLVLIAAALAGCASKPAPIARRSSFGPGEASGVSNAPPFAQGSYAPFSRADAVAIALREWRLWGQPVDDDPPDTRPQTPLDAKPERAPGLWERVGEYWWTGQDAGSRTAAWTGRHDETGAEFANDARFAWSAAFVSYVMRVAGAGRRFPYSPTHADYINAAREQSIAGSGPYAITAEPLDGYAPRLGDIICMGRGSAARLTFADLPTRGGFPGHCDIVVATAPGQLSVVGGNIDDAVTMKHVPVTPDGLLAPAGGPAVDTRYDWLAVLKVMYDA